MGRRAGSRLRVRDLRGYVANDPFDTVRYDELRTRLRTVPELVAAFNVRWVLWAPHPMRGFGDHVMRRPPHVAAPARFRQLDAKRWEVIDPAPLVAWYGAAEVVADRKRALKAMVAREQSGAPRRRVIVETADLSRDLGGTERVSGPPAAVPGRLVDYGANRTEVAVDAPAPGIVVLDEVMAAGWEVEVDGRAAEGFRAEFLLRAVLVGAGHHVITWSYHPPGFVALFVIWLVGVGGVLVAGIAAWRCRRARVASET
jgi:hypothetical protein